ncbi:MAG: hypothetical protein AAGE52_39445 [Myxococcota bacterium]
MGLLERALTLTGLAVVLAEVLLLTPLRWLWRKRKAVVLTFVALVVLLLSTGALMHAFVLEPAVELRGHDRNFFNISAGLFDALRGRDATLEGMNAVLDNEPHRRSVQNIEAWAVEHDEPELAERAHEMAAESAE